MLRTTRTGTRALSHNVQNAVCIYTSSRLLHDLSSVTGASRDPESKRVPWDEVFGEVGKVTDKSTTLREPMTEEEFQDFFRIKRPLMKKEFRQFFKDPRLMIPKQSDAKRVRKKEELKTKWPFKGDVALQKKLRPAVQSARVKELAEKGNVEEAVSYLISAPRATVNTITWNTLINVMMRLGKRKRAYDIYTEMKRRGFQPDVATYSTMLHGMAQIESKEWPNNQENLERCHKLYNAFEKLVQTGEVQQTSARTTYFQVLGRSGNYQKMFDLFYKEDGALPRDKALYTVLFNALLWRKETDKLGNLTLQEQNASDAKFLWRVLEKDVQGGMEIDAHLLRPFIKLMAAGRPVDQRFGLKVVCDYFGLAAPGEPTPTPRVTMNSNCLHAILELCNKAKKFRLCTYFFKEVMTTKQIERNSKFFSDLTIGTRHVNEQLIALAQLASVGSTDEAARAVDAVRFLKQTTALKAVKPPNRTNEWDEDTTLQPETVKLALAVCWRCGDWESATQIFSLATDLRAEDFLDDGPIAKESEKPFIPGNGRMVDIAAFSYLTRIALSTKDKAKMRQALRMMYIYGIGSGAFVTHYNFYKIELAKTILKLLDAASSDQPGDGKKWKYLKQESREALSKRVMVERPESEEDGLGSQKYISKLQQAIDFELASRSSS